jgi:membrane fusion protein (multidrug efflux system)
MADEIKSTPVLDAPKKPVTGSPQGSETASPLAAGYSLHARSNPRTKFLILGIVLVLAVAGFFLWRYLAGYESTDDAQIDGHINAISARVSGYVMKVNVDDNQYVNAGTVLVQVDPKDYQVAVDKARADLADAQATARALGINVPISSVNTSSQLRSSVADLESARAGVTAAERQVIAAHAQLDQQIANDVKAQADLARYKQLLDKQEISEQQYDQAVAAAKASTAGVEASRAAEAAAQQQVLQAGARVAQAQAGLQAAQTAPQQVASSRDRAASAAAVVQQKQAALEQAELNLQYTSIVAPVSGVVNKDVELGMNVQPGQQLLSIVPLDDVWVTADFKETQLKFMRPGQPAEISVDAYGRTFKGHVESIAGASGSRFSLLPPENATGNYVKVVQRIPVKIVLERGENREHLLRPGMSVVPRVQVK